MIEFYVRSVSELSSALNQVKAGDAIYLASGDYSSVNIKNFDVSGKVTITSLDHTNPAVLHDLFVKNSSGLSFSNLEFSAVAGDNNAFQVLGSSNISLHAIVAHGPAGGNEVSPIMIRSSTGVSITNSEFYDVQHGIKMLDSSNVSISDNYFHDIRTDGIRGGGVSELKVSGNVFTDFHPAEGDHPDAIQLWSTNQNQRAGNIEITGNIIVRGDGDPIQGVFIRDTNDKLPFENVRITENVVLGGLYNGISLDGANGGTIKNNLVVGYEDQRSWIRLNKDVDVSIKDNIATKYSFDTRNDDRVSDNILVEEVDVNIGAALNEWTKRTGISLAGSSLIEEALAAHSGKGGIITQPGQVPVPDMGSKPVVLADGETVLRLTEAQIIGQGNDGDNRLMGNDHANELYGMDGNDLVQGLGGDDKLVGGRGDDDLRGGDGHDILQGGDGDDILSGDTGNDQLFGGNGADMIYGGVGSDVMSGGAGADRFLYRAGDLGNKEVDIILDFEPGKDVLNLRAVDAIAGTAKDDNFKFIGNSTFHGKAGELNYRIVDGDAHVSGDLDGDGRADFTIILQDVMSVSADFFIL